MILAIVPCVKSDRIDYYLLINLLVILVIPISFLP